MYDDGPVYVVAVALVQKHCPLIVICHNSDLRLQHTHTLNVTSQLYSGSVRLLATEMLLKLNAKRHIS